MEVTLKKDTRIACLCLTLGIISSVSAKETIPVLIVDGQNNHDVWPQSTIIMKKQLEDTGMFSVDIARTKYIWNSGKHKAWLPMAGVEKTEAVGNPQTDPDFKPDFSKYKLVVNNLGYQAADWPAETQKSFEEYMKNGGGLVSVHAADNCWPKWKEYNIMIGVGGWGGRNEQSGPHVYWQDENFVRDTSPGAGGTHGPQKEFAVDTRNEDHPIMKGIPKSWMHTTDELYARLRGPAENMTVLATGLSDVTRKHEPVLMTIEYHKGRVFHTVLGHDTPSYESVGFITTFLRGCEWAATGKVTMDIPDDFPTDNKSSARPCQIKP